jgi:hypothetical protein
MCAICKESVNKMCAFWKGSGPPSVREGYCPEAKSSPAGRCLSGIEERVSGGEQQTRSPFYLPVAGCPSC